MWCYKSCGARNLGAACPSIEFKVNRNFSFKNSQAPPVSKNAGKGAGKRGRPPRKRHDDEDDDSSAICSADEREWEEEQNRSMEIVEDDEGLAYQGEVGKKGKIVRKGAGRSENAKPCLTSDEENYEGDNFESFQAKKSQNKVKMFGKGVNSFMAEVDEDGDFF
jgi:hypothetical protein